MTLSVSPALAQVETALKVSPGSFAKNNYHSVFDVAHTSRKQFIAANMAWLGQRGGKAWDLALGQAQHIRRLFRESQLTRRIRQGLPQTLSGQPTVSSTSSNNIQGLVQNGPTWQNQFAENWQAYCQSSAPEAVDSPVSYLTWLYQQATRFEEEIQASSTADKVLTLAKRRPDLAALTVDNDAINQQIPTLQLVNEILESSIATVLPDGQSVDQALAETRYPTLLPYHFSHDQVELSLQNADVPLEDIISQTATDWPWFLGDSWCGERSNSSTELASRLAPEQQTLVIEPDNSTASDLTSFYKTNLGLETTDYTPFEDFDMFTYQLGITVPQMEELIAGSAGGSCVVVSKNVEEAQYAASSACYGASLINNNATPSIGFNNIDRRDDSLKFLHGAESVTGAFGEGILFDSTKGESAFFPYDIFQNMSEDVTLGFWLKLSSDIPFNALLVCNITGNNLQAPGIVLSVGSYNGKVMQLNISDGKNSLNNNKDLSYLKFDEWKYYALAYSASNKTITFYQGTWGVDFDVSKMTSLSSDANSLWFNGNPDEMYYQAYPDCTCQASYDDITIWNRCLTEDDITTIINSSVPVAQIPELSDYAENCNFENLVLSLKINNLSDARMDRINRMVRLQRWLGLSYEETDLLLSACIHAQGTDNSDYSLNAHTLRALGVFRHWQQKYDVSAFEFAAVLDVITPYAISPAVPFFDQVFNSPSLFDAPFAITGADFSYTDLTGDSARTVRQICAGLDITQAQFRVLADRVAAEQGDAEAKTLPLTLAVVSALYRLVMVPRWLGLAFADGAALLSLAGEGDVAWTVLAGVPQLAALSDGQPAGGDILDLLMALEAAAVWAADHKLSWVKNYLALQAGTAALVATSATVNFVNGIKQQLPAALLSEQSFAAVPLPAGSDASGWLTIFPDLVDDEGLVLAAATDYDTITAVVSADIDAAGITFATDADREQAVSTLSGIINQARLTQNGIADSALAQMFSTAQSLPSLLLSWAGDSEYRLLADSLAMNSGAALTDPAQVPASYLTTLFAVGQRAGISSAFSLTPAALSLFLAHPDWFGVSDTTLTLTLLYRLSRYADWLGVAGDEDRVLGYLAWVNGATPPDATQAAKALALLLGWESSEVVDATAALPGSLAKSVTDVDYVMRLRTLSAETGLSVTPLLATGELTPGGVTDTWDAWQSAGESLVAAQSGTPSL